MAAYADFLATFKKVPEPARFKQGGSMNVKLVAVVKSKSDFAFAAQKFKDCLPSLHMRFDTFESQLRGFVEELTSFRKQEVIKKSDFEDLKADIQKVQALKTEFINEHTDADRKFTEKFNELLDAKRE